MADPRKSWLFSEPPQSCCFPEGAGPNRTLEREVASFDGVDELTG